MQYRNIIITRTKRAILALPLVLCASDIAQAQDTSQVWKKGVLPVPFFVSDFDSNDPINPATVKRGTPLYDRRSHEPKTKEGLPLVPITAPDGHHITWGEWSSVEGTLRVTCNERGTRVAVWLSGLIPNGVYTLWNLVWQAPGPVSFPVDKLPENLIGLGPVGPADGSRNTFRASDTGFARTVIYQPAGELGTVGSIGDCAPVDSYEWHIVGLYHYDNQTYGSVLGPAGTMAEQFGFIIKQ